jgi:hypothetical protein
VHYPDGHYTDGIERHIADMSAWFAYAPDLRIKVHPMRIAKDNLTAVVGVMQGTFTKPMPDGKGGSIAPTGNAFAVDMVTVGIWNRHGTWTGSPPWARPTPIPSAASAPEPATSSTPGCG